MEGAAKQLTFWNRFQSGGWCSDSFLFENNGPTDGQERVSEKKAESSLIYLRTARVKLVPCRPFVLSISFYFSSFYKWIRNKRKSKRTFDACVSACNLPCRRLRGAPRLFSCSCSCCCCYIDDFRDNNKQHTQCTSCVGGSSAQPSARGLYNGRVGSGQ